MISGTVTVAHATLCLLILAVASGCAGMETREMEVTAYCGCGECCGWERGSWKFLKLDVWNRYVTADWGKGRRYTGKTAGGTRPHPPRPGLFSRDSLRRPWMVPVRILLPWNIQPRKGTLAADTDFYPFGTEIYVPGWGWGVVEDRGSAIKGPDSLDAFFRFHYQTERWGRQRLEVKIPNAVEGASLEENP